MSRSDEFEQKPIGNIKLSTLPPMSETSLPRKPPRTNSTTVTQETRRPKKPRNKKPKSQPITPNNEASGSSVNLSLPGPSTPPKNGASATFEENDDFVAFTFSDGEDKYEEDDTPIREWERGKRSYEGSHGKKRKADEVEREDRYSSKRNRLDHVPRKAPWVVDVDWQSCNNVPEL